MADVVWVKLLSALILGISKLISGLIPVYLFSKLKTRPNYAVALETFMAVVLCLGGGLLMASVFLHILPEVRESLESASESGLGFKNGFPAAEFVVCLGFFMIFLVEAIVHTFFGEHGHREQHQGVSNAFVEEKRGKDNKAFQQHELVHSTLSNSNYTGVYDNASPATLTRFKRIETSPTHSNNGNNVANVGNGNNVGKGNNVYTVNNVDLEANAKKEDAEDGMLHTVRYVLLTLAMSLHGFFEGMAVGLQPESQDVWLLLFPIVSHALPIFFFIGLDMLMTSTRSKSVVVHVSVMSVVGSLGVLAGMWVTNEVGNTSATQSLVIGVLQGVAGGTLLYIVFFEVLDKRRLEKLRISQPLAVILVILGFAIMTGLQSIGGHGHSHGGGHDHHGHGEHDAQHGDHDEHGEHQHGHDHHDHEEHEHGEHAEHDHGEEEEHEEHDHDHDALRARKNDGHGHGHDEHEHDDHDDHGHGHGHGHGGHDENDEHGHDDHEHGHEEHEHDHDGKGHGHSHDHDHDHDDHDHEGEAEAQDQRGADLEPDATTTDHDHERRRRHVPHNPFYRARRSVLRRMERSVKSALKTSYDKYYE